MEKPKTSCEKHQQCLHLYIQSISHHDLLPQGSPVSLRQENAEVMQDEAEEPFDAPQFVGQWKTGEVPANQ